MTPMGRISAAIVFAALALAGPAAAGPAGSGPFGLGIIVGEPTGIDAKWFLTSTTALEGATAWSLSGNNRFHLQVDYLVHDYDMIQVSKGKAPFFYGIGGRVQFRENEDDRLGLRVPVGVGYEFPDGPFDVFFELAPVIELAPDTDFTLEGALGGRFWF